MRPNRRTLLLIVAAIAATISASLADPIDSASPCLIALQAFDSEKRAGEVLAGAPSPQVLEVGDYIIKAMEQLDRQYTEAGKPGVWSSFSDAGKHAIAASAVANCRLHPDRTIYKAADAVYQSVRDIHIQLGIVK